jgi:hypothetical protein
MVAAANPGDPAEPATWPTYRQLLPHVLVLDLISDPEPPGRQLVLDLTDYLINIGAAATAEVLARRATGAWNSGTELDDELAPEASSRLARALFWLGRYEGASELDEAVYQERLRTHGPSARETLKALHNLAVDLTALGGAGGPGILARATGLHAEVVREQGRLFGRDDPDTLQSAHNQAFHLRTLGEPAQALALEESVYETARARLGAGHPYTLRSARALAQDLRGAGELERARELQEAAYLALVDTVGPDHLDALHSAALLVRDLRATGEHARALTLHADTVTRLRRVADGPDLPVWLAATASPRRA